MDKTPFGCRIIFKKIDGIFAPYNYHISTMEVKSGTKEVF
jgi:hypothetical protein